MEIERSLHEPITVARPPVKLLRMGKKVIAAVVWSDKAEALPLHNAPNIHTHSVLVY